MGTTLKITNVNKAYARQDSPLEALLNISLTARPGEMISLVGPSGCGKTTLLRIAAGLIFPSSGTVTIDQVSPSDFQRVGNIGFVFQRSVLFPWRTVIENILLPAEINSDSNIFQTRNRAMELVDLIGLKGFENVYPRQLSGGMAQRAAVARAILKGPELLLLDEPFAALDDITREQMWADLSRIWNLSRPTVLLVTHNVREAVFFGHRVLIMSAGPGQIHEVVDVNTSSTRDKTWLSSPEFIITCERIRALLICR